MRFLNRSMFALLTLFAASTGSAWAQNSGLNGGLFGSDARQSAETARLQAQAQAQASPLILTNAWYGTEAKPFFEINRMPVVEKLRTQIQGGYLVIPADLGAFLGGDPLPGVVKTVAVAVTYYGQRFNIRQTEGKALTFPGIPGENYQLASPEGGNVEVQGAWYGVEAGPKPDVTNKIRSTMMSGNVYVPADMNKFFGTDPAPGRAKRVAVNVRWKGVVYNLRQLEGRALQFPGIEGTDYLQLKEATNAQIEKYFDYAFYMLKYPDLQEAFGLDKGKLTDHYFKFGIREGRDPSPNISISALRMRYPTLAVLYGDDYSGLMQHYVANATTNTPFNGDPLDAGFADKGAFATPLLAYFDAQYYFSKNPSVCGNPELTLPRGISNACASGGSFNFPAVVEHYVNKGAVAGLKAHNVPIGPPQSANGKEAMRVGDWLGVNEYLVSRSGQKIAVMQSNADFAVYNTSSPSTASSANGAGLHTGNVNSDNGQSFYIVMQGDGHLCTYRGRNPSDQKGTVGCTGPVMPIGQYYLHLQSDNNLVIRAGVSVYDDRGYVWDFRTKKSGSSFGQFLSAIKSAVGCR